MIAISQAVLDRLSAIIWIALSMYTCIGTISRLWNMQSRVLTKFFVGIAFFGSWVLLQVYVVVWVSLANYCESCSEKPLTLHDIWMYLIMISPSFLALIVSRSLLPKKFERTGR